LDLKVFAQQASFEGATSRLAWAGFFATAIAYGPARIGFGLFLPAFREDFELSTALAGLIAGGGFLAFLLALPVAAWLDRRVAERLPVLVGIVSATVGFTIVATASGAGVLAVGVAIAGASAGFCWSPFEDAVERIVSEEARPGALSIVSTGTTTGVAVAGALALGVAFGAIDWRTVWFIFGFVGLIALVTTIVWVPSGRGDSTPRTIRAPRLMRRRALPMYATAFVFGATNSIYISFAADRIVAAGSLPGLPGDAASAVMFLSYGIFGIVGLATGWMVQRVGLALIVASIFTAFATSLAIIALIPGSWLGVALSAGLQGAAVMMVSAVLSFWSLRLFPGRGSVGFTVALVMAAAGSVLAGPWLAGSLIDAIGTKIAFLSFAIPPFAVALAFATWAYVLSRRPTGQWSR